MTRGTAGGPWPAAWKPVNLGSPAQSRSPIVPFAGGSRAFYSTLDGWVHAIDAKTGAILWQTQIGSVAVAAPAGIFVAYGGAWDYVLVGTRQASGNRFYALDPGNGAVIDYYPKAGDPLGLSALGAVTGMATVDYARGQVYFAAYQATTLLALVPQAGPAVRRPAVRVGGPRVQPSATSTAARSSAGTGCTSATSTAGCGRSTPRTGTALYSWDTGDGNVKGFPFPDRRNGDVYFVTTINPLLGRLVGVTDTGTAFNSKWSQVAQKPLDAASLHGHEQAVRRERSWPSRVPGCSSTRSHGSVTNTLDLESSAVVIGAPSLDLGVSPNMLYVGSAAGVIYATEVPF